MNALRIDGDHVIVETIFSPEQKEAGSFTLADLKKVDDKYAGTQHHGSTCLYTGFKARLQKRQESKQCIVEDAIEIVVLTPKRIEGRILSYPPNAKFDCDECTYEGAKAWQSFAWIPE